MSVRMFRLLISMLVGALVLGCAAEPARANAAVSREEAIAAAARVARDLELPFSHRVTAELKERESPPYRGTPLWVIELPEFSHFRVDAGTGSVLSFFDMSAWREAHASPPKTAVPAGDAVAIATHVLQTLGMPDDLLFGQARCHPYCNDQYRWTISWHRSHGGIPLAERTAKVSLDAATGKALAGYIDPLPPAPESWELKVSAADAVDKAVRQVCQASTRTPQMRTDARLMLVQPNWYYSSEGEQPPRSDDPSRLAWVIGVWAGYPGFPIAGHHIYWVDAADGTILGGKSTR